MTASHRYDYDWISKVPGIEGAFRFCPGDTPEGDWLSSIQVWSAFGQSVIEYQDVSLGRCIKRFPVRALAGSLRIMASAQDPEDALLLLRTFARLADLPIRLNLETEDEMAFIMLSLEGVDTQIMADLEVMLLTLFMTGLNWMVGKTIPYMATYSRSHLFQARHPYHPEFDCEVRVSDWTGACLPYEWLKLPLAQEGARESVSDVLTWLVFGNYGEVTTLKSASGARP